MPRITLGFVGPRLPAGERARWNALLSKQGIDGCYDFYRAASRDDLQLRLSEMFLLDRRGYAVAAEWEHSVVELLDTLDDAARTAGRADTVVNIGGVLHGTICGHADASMAKRLSLWAA